MRNPHNDGCRFTQVCCIGELHSVTAVHLVLNKTKHCHDYISGKLRAIINQTKIPLKKIYKTKLDVGPHEQGSFLVTVRRVSARHPGSYLLCGSSWNHPCLRSQRCPLEKSAFLIRSSCCVCWFLLIRQAQLYLHLLES